ncbi:hypothetical protein Trco_001969 [Trichoderma cornu-damae]|uniref:Secreted protein n=1 Tax=Trichoderma cornu-damae TaxID=654480 RepID=A0A9P8QTS4_9HYPO|nr:hypothetical protein Trco_001969 [Trichoderma cornu-damae]
MHFLATITSLASVAAAGTAYAPPSSSSSPPSNAELGNEIFTKAAVDVNAALTLAADYKCPAPMAYSPWARSCSCPPGQNYDTVQKLCLGAPMKGAWPEPKCPASGVVASLGVFCAISPTKFTKYDAAHAWCQVGVNTFTFCAQGDIEAEIAALGLGVNKDVELNVASASTSAALRNVSAGLAGLFVETIAEAFVTFNTDAFGLDVVAADVEVSLTSSVFARIQAAACLLGLGQCHFDCVSFCTKGCHNYIDVVGDLGGRLVGLNGVTILPDVVLSVDSSFAVVSLAIKDLLCTSHKLDQSTVRAYNYTC